MSALTATQLASQLPSGSGKSTAAKAARAAAWRGIGLVEQDSGVNRFVRRKAKDRSTSP